MSKHLKLIYSISFLIICLSVQAKEDTLVKKRLQYWAYAHIGVPMYNKLEIGFDKYAYDDYWMVNSKKKAYTIGFGHRYEKFNRTLAFSYVQNEYTGKDFRAGSNQIFEKYNVYQKVKYNVLQGYLGFGYAATIKPKHEIIVNINFLMNLGYNIRISNYYSSNQLGFDTTKYGLEKNGLMLNKKFFSDGLAIGSGLSISYNYLVTKKIAFSFGLHSQYIFAMNYIDSDAYSDEVFDFLRKHDGAYNAYYIRSQTIIAPSIGIKYRL